MTLMSFTAYAKHAKKSKARISKLREQGMLDSALVKINGRKYPQVDSEIADRILAAELDPNYTEGSPADQMKNGGDTPGGGKDTSFVQARTWAERYKAAERKLNYEIKSGQFISKAEVRDQAFKAARLFRDSLLNVGPRIASIVAGETREEKCLEIIHAEHKDLLDELVRQLTMLGD